MIFNTSLFTNNIDLKQRIIVRFWPVAALFFIVYIPLSFFVFHTPVTGYVHAFALLYLIITMVCFVKTKNISLVSNMLAALGIPAIMPWIFDGGPFGSGFWWTIVFVPWALLVTNKKSAIFWLSVYFLIAVTIAGISTTGIIKIYYSIAELLNLLYASVLTFSFVYFFNQANSYYLNLALKEINERKKAEEKLTCAQKIAKVGSWKWDITTGKETWSDEQFRIFGFEPGEVEASYNLFISMLHPEDKQDVLDSVVKAFDGIKEFDLEYRIILRSGVIRFIDAKGEIFKNEKGIPETMIGTVRDITDYKLAEKIIKDSEERFFKIFENNPVGMTLSNLETSKIEFVNSVFLNIIGYTEEEVIGKTSKDLKLLTNEERENKIKMINEKGYVKDVERLLVKKNNETCWVLLSAQIIVLDEKKFLLSSVYDIQHRKEIEKELQFTKRQAEESVILKEAFLANMSHEIRTPMNAIVGFNSILSTTDLDKKQAELVSHINTASENLLTLINDILDYSKIEAGMMQIENTVVHLQSMLEKIHSISQGMAIKKKLDISLFISPSLPEYIICDPTRISQAIVNLLSNAIKFTEEGSVSLRAEPCPENNDSIQFIIRDTGIGIATENFKIIFERFKQERLDTARMHGGTGLGLSIVKSITELLGGQILVNSELNSGSEFILQIPFKPCSEKQIEYYLIEKNKKEIKPHLSIGKLNVLIVEDNRMNQQYCRMLLNESGHNCTIVNNGIEAIEAIRHRNYDLILLDLQLPQIDGYSTARIIRLDLNNKTPIIALTANALTGEQTKCMEIGMNGYLAKPFKPYELNQIIIDTILNKANSSHEEPAVPCKPSIKSKYLDYNYLLEQVNGNPEGVQELIEIFINDHSNDLKILKNNIDKRDFIAIGKSAHQLITSFAILGIDEAISLLKEIEMNANKEKEINRIKYLYKKLINIIGGIEKEIMELNYSFNQ